MRSVRQRGSGRSVSFALLSLKVIILKSNSLKLSIYGEGEISRPGQLFQLERGQAPLPNLEKSHVEIAHYTQPGDNFLLAAVNQLVIEIN